jgi:hypothetical protein
LSEKIDRAPSDFLAHANRGGLDYIMKSLARFWIGAGSAAMVTLLPAIAAGSDAPHHRLEFEADRAMPACNQALKFKA